MLPFDLRSQILATTLVPTDRVFAPDLVVVALAPAPGPLRAQFAVNGPSAFTVATAASLPISALRSPTRLDPAPSHVPRAPTSVARAEPSAHVFTVWRRLTPAPPRGWLNCSEYSVCRAVANRGSRRAPELGVPISGDTILRRVKAEPAEHAPSYRFVGIDDFALRKGHTYGTIWVDLQCARDRPVRRTRRRAGHGMVGRRIPELRS
ncbi:Transposase of ISAli18. ISL3 family OS=Azospirillum lipoferum (strain 4B) GN=AZOLI_p60153 PE=4 SV=1 [Gemmata massiliana]|uniref:Transposase of ISAli18. ISL3 family n=1 Tax=Gemmata massiliana TaxID=1210884 RepID=A0A6P2CW89_9BACT|nr:hypothetical protein [Gemmata massiliana]VTR92656.1 Transposase of ISAli18. ISL3 family OS=Azospirillum lipoferum (strain 4B) GN=AZOLI_p60153 PE=4 SV=1 [Gemmata massiliana]